MCPPQSQIGPIPLQTVKGLIEGSPISGRYDQIVDRESAYEMLAVQAQKEAERLRQEQEKNAERAAHRETFRYPSSRPQRERSRSRKDHESGRRKPKPRSNRQGVAETFFKSAARSFGSQIGRKVFRGLLGGLLK